MSDTSNPLPSYSQGQFPGQQLTATETMVVDLANGATIVIAHPGRAYTLDPDYLRNLFGVTPNMVIPISQSRARQLSEVEKAEEHAVARARELIGGSGRLARLRGMQIERRVLLEEGAGKAVDERIAELDAQIAAAEGTDPEAAVEPPALTDPPTSGRRAKP